MPHSAPFAYAGLRQRALNWLTTPSGVVVILALLILPSLGRFPLFNDDEGAFSEATREMLQSGDWLSTTLNGAPRFDKPILIYWLQAVSVRLFGLNEFGLRLPSALATLAWVGAIARFAVPRFGRIAGISAAWIAATSLGVLAIGRAATADALLNLWIALSMFELWRHFEREPTSASGRTAPELWRFYAWVGLGVLTKGPIAVLVPGSVALLASVSSRQGAALGRLVLFWPGWFVAAAIALPWYLAEWHVKGQAFIDGFFVRHNLDRFHGTLEGHSGSLLYYVVVAPALLLPWSGALPLLALKVKSWWPSALHRFLLLWFGFVFVFFSLSGTKLPHYLMYGLTPVFLLMAAALRDARRWQFLWLPTLGCVLLLCLPWIAAYWAQTHASTLAPPYLAQISRAVALAHRGDYLPVGFAALGLCCAVALVPGRLQDWQRGILAGVAFAVMLIFALTPWLGAVLQDPVKHAAQIARLSPRPGVQWNYSAPSFSVYREEITPARPPEPGEIAITRIDRLPPDVPVLMLYEEGGIALVQRLEARDSAARP